MTDNFSALKKRLARLNQAPLRPHRLACLAFATVLCVALGASMPLRFAARAQSARSSLPSVAENQKRFQKGYYRVYHRIPRDNTPEAAVGLPASLDDAQGNATITGRVLYENGKPASGIKVSTSNRWLSQTELWGYKRNQANHYRWPEKIARLLSGTTTTRADGTYRFTGLLPQYYRIHLTPIGLNRAPLGWLAPERGVSVVAVAKRSRRAPDTVLSRSALVRIRVVDQESGAPLEGVELRGFTVDQGASPTEWGVDAHRKSRAMKDYPYDDATDDNGYCTLSLGAGKIYFFVVGGLYVGEPAGGAAQNPAPSKFDPFSGKFITSQGIYKANSWCQVARLGGPPSEQAFRRSWDGETEFQLKKGQPANFVIKIQRLRPLTPPYKELLQFIKQHVYPSRSKNKRK